MRLPTIMIFSICAIVSIPALACRFAPGYDTFQFGVPNPSGIGPETPSLTGYKIKRGYDDGDFASCSDAGIIELYFERTHGVGYLFEALGTFENTLFPEEVVQIASGKDHFSFVWLDGSRNDQEPINLAVRVTAYYPNGKSSSPMEFRIVHLGGRSDG